MSIPRAPTGYNMVQLPRMSTQQMQRQQERLGQLGPQAGMAQDLLSKLALGDESAYSKMEAPALRAFQEKIIPQLSEQFGSGGMLRSSAFANAAAGAGTDLAERLGAQRAGIQQNALKNLLGLEQSLLSQSPYEFGLAQKPEKKKKWWETLLGSAGGIAQLGSLFL